MGLSTLFQNREEVEEKLNYDNESEINSFEDLDADAYYDMIDDAYANIERNSRLCRATRGCRKFYTDIAIEDDDTNEDAEDTENAENTEDTENVENTTDTTKS